MIQQHNNNCTRHHNHQNVGVCMSKNFLKGEELNDWRICLKCMSLYSKEYNDFLLFEDINDKNEFQIQEYPFDTTARKIKNFLNETQVSSKKIFTKEIELIDQLVEQMKEIKTQLMSIQDGYEKIEHKTINKLKHQYSEVYGIQHIKQALKQNKSKYETTKEVEQIKSELFSHFNQLIQLRESHDIRQQISSFSSGTHNFIHDRLQSLFDNARNSINLQSFEQISIEDQSGMQLVELARSKVPYPDALNIILYSKESFTDDSCTYKLIFQNNQNFEDKCHFFIGCIDSELKDTCGYNHEMPCVCFVCHFKSKEIKLSQIKQLSITASFDIKQNQVHYHFNDNLCPSINISYNFQPLKEWKLFISSCFPLKFKVYKV